MVITTVITTIITIVISTVITTVITIVIALVSIEPPALTLEAELWLTARIKPLLKISLATTPMQAI